MHTIASSVGSKSTGLPLRCLRFCKRNENHHRARRISAGSAGKWLAIASGKRRAPSGRSIRAITPRRICRLETPNCWFDGFQRGAEKVKLICANCDEARPWRATESFFAGQSSKQQFWKESFGLREFLLIHRWPRAAKLLVSRRSKP